jgi:1-acyl-sn-glycerol-3-phosphate acyltransferase
VLFVCNHASYADISIIGAHIRGCFVAKAEVANWPLFGICAKLSRTVFVDRRARYAREQAEEMKRRFQKGDRLILFAEGTSSDGNRVLPFRSSLFATAEIEVDGKPVTVQPVSLAYARLDGIPMGRHLRPFFAWYGDMDMFSHLWGIVGVGRSTVVLEFHKPVSIRDFPDRKALAAHCQAVVAAGVSSALSGRPQPVVLPNGVAELAPRSQPT